MTIAAYEYKREQARTARQEASELRELHQTANCGLDLRLNYGTKYVPRHIVLRIADQFPIWAAEYEATAERLEAEMAAMLTSSADLSPIVFDPPLTDAEAEAFVAALPSSDEAERARVFDEMREIDNAIEAGSTGTGNQEDGDQ